MILADWQIRDAEIFSPFSEAVAANRVISYGLSSYGYDLRLGPNFKTLGPKGATSEIVIDPKAGQGYWQDVRADHAFIMAPRQCALAETVEEVHMPDHCLGVVLGKSTYARCMLLVNTTWLEPGWRGKVTLELANLTDRYLKLYVGEGIAQACFLKGAPCQKTYADKKGKYQGQTGVTPAKI